MMSTHTSDGSVLQPPPPIRTGTAANRLVAELPSAERDYLLHYLKPVCLNRGQILYREAGPAEFAYFPVNSVVSLLSLLEDGTTKEVAMVGGEGLVGLPALFAGEEALYSAAVLVPGAALSIRADVLVRLFDQSAAARRVLMKYYLLLLSQVSRTCVCMSHHHVYQQLCRWLLTARDRTGTDQLDLTHERIAASVGARRPGITECLNLLRQKGAIELGRCRLVILDRRVLERDSCECYRSTGAAKNIRGAEPPRPRDLVSGSSSRCDSYVRGPQAEGARLYE